MKNGKGIQCPECGYNGARTVDSRNGANGKRKYTGVSIPVPEI